MNEFVCARVRREHLCPIRLARTARTRALRLERSTLCEHLCSVAADMNKRVRSPLRVNAGTRMKQCLLHRGSLLAAPFVNHRRIHDNDTSPVARGRLIRNRLIGTASALATAVALAAWGTELAHTQVRDFHVEEATIENLHSAIQTGQTTVARMVRPMSIVRRCTTAPVRRSLRRTADL